MKVGPTNVITNSFYATERQSVPLGHASSAQAWDAAVAGYPASCVSSNSNCFYDNAGWVKGVHQTADGKWGGYIWLLQNTMNFKTSETNIWISTNGVTNVIFKVLVGTIGDYAPMETNVDTGPTVEGLTNNPPTGGSSDNMTYMADFTAYYDIGLPVIRIEPLLTNVCVNSGNVTFWLITNSYVASVNWSITPEGLTNGAGLTNYASYAVVNVGGIATSYVVKAMASNNTNVFGSAVLNVVEMGSPLQYKIGTEAWADMPDPLYVSSNTVVDFKSIKVPSDASWPSGKPVWTFEGQSGGAGTETNSHAFTTVSSSTTDYKLVTTECGNTVTGKVIVVSVKIILTTTNDYGVWWFNGENAANYGERGKLTAQGAIEETGSFQWDVIVGANTVDLNYGLTDADSIFTTVNEITIKSTGASTVSNDITVKLTYNSTVVAQTNFTVYTPKEEIETNVVHIAWTDGGYTNGYESQHKFKILDQLGNLLPAQIEINENWTETAQNDHAPTNNWPQCDEEVWSANPANGIDYLRQCRGETNNIPNTQNPQTPPGNIKVYHWTGEHYAGSQINSNGVKVLIKKWQYYQDHGRRE